MQHIIAAFYCGTYSGDEILGRSLILQGEKEQERNQTWATDLDVLHSNIQDFPFFFKQRNKTSQIKIQIKLILHTI